MLTSTKAAAWLILTGVLWATVMTVVVADDPDVTTFIGNLLGFWFVGAILLVVSLAVIRRRSRGRP